MTFGQILLGGVPYLEKDDNVETTWTINGTIEMIWQGKRFGERLAFRRTYDLDIHKHVSDIYKMFFKELSNHLIEIKELYYLRNNYVVPPSLFEKANLATLNEVLTKQGLHHLDQLLTNGGEYEIPRIYKYCDNTDCIRTIVKHATDLGVKPIRNPDGCSD